MGIADTLDTIMQNGTGPTTTTVQVDHRVTRSLTMCRYYKRKNRRASSRAFFFVIGLRQAMVAHDNPC